MTAATTSSRRATAAVTEAVPQSLLAFDSAGAACSAAVWRDGKLVAHRFEAMGRGQSERLVPMIVSVMTEAALGYEQLDALAVTVGPGGFTGVRIGLATARGLALARGLPVIGVTNFEAVAAAVGQAELAGRKLVVLLETKRRDFYLQCFDSAGRDSTEPLLVPPEGLDERLPPDSLLLAGDAAARALPSLIDRGRDAVLAVGAEHTDAAWLAQVAAGRTLPPADASPPEPLYLRAPDVGKTAAAPLGQYRRP